MAGQPERKLTFNGVFRVAGGAVAPSIAGAVDTRSNGIAISPDGKKVYAGVHGLGEGPLRLPRCSLAALGPPARRV
ncbi:MAG: hypothetical protein IPI49_17515 [Myxococcales bacterium]|nr:hypothetical protein [Myxococcales bacterium]